MTFMSCQLLFIHEILAYISVFSIGVRFYPIFLHAVIKSEVYHRAVTLKKKIKESCLLFWINVFYLFNFPMISGIFLAIFAGVHVKLINRKSGYFEKSSSIWKIPLHIIWPRFLQQIAKFCNKDCKMCAL